MPEGKGYNGKQLRDLGEKWIERIRSASTREEGWLKDAEAAEKTYSMDEKKAGFGDIPDFNILHSNVETIVPAIYNSTPVPDIRPKWSLPEPELPEGVPPEMAEMADPNKPVKDTAECLERAIAVQIDDNKLDTEVEASALDAFMAGRGIVRVRMDSDIEEFTEEEEVIAEDGMISYEEATYQQVSNERVIYEAVAWRDYREGPANRFEDLPWVAFRHMIDKDALEEFDQEMISSQNLDGYPVDSSEGDLVVWEVWCKKSRSVKFVREDTGVILSVEDDPLGLSGFFPIPKPVQPITLTAKREPINPYKVYRKQAEELDRITKRIRAIISGLKVRGGIVGDAENISEVSKAGDNELVPIRNVEGLAQTGGLDKAIVWWPVDRAIQVLRELYVSREQIKQLIYEITGISDIVRGASNVAETATAQQIKTQWGSLRIKKMQRLIERQVRDLFVLSAEVIAKNFSPDRLQEITGMQVTDEMMQLLDAGIQQYIIDVESDSTVRADLTRAKGEMSEFLNGTAQFFSTMAPVVQQAPEMAGSVVDLYSSFARQFNLGKQAEAAVEQMGDIAKKAGQQQGPSPEQQAQMAEMQAKAQEQQAKLQLEQQKLQLEMGKIQADMEVKKADLALKQSDLQLKDAEATTKAAQAQADSEAKEELHRMEIRLKEIDLEIKAADLAMRDRHAQQELIIEREQERAAKIGDD